MITKVSIYFLKTNEIMSEISDDCQNLRQSSMAKWTN
jgi:hypothetical protein